MNILNKNINIILMFFIIFTGALSTWNNLYVISIVGVSGIMFFWGKKYNIYTLLIVWYLILQLIITSFSNSFGTVISRINFSLYGFFFIFVVCNTKKLLNNIDVLKLLKIVRIFFNILIILSILEYLMQYNPFFSWLFKEKFRDIYEIKGNIGIYRISSSFSNSLITGQVFTVAYILNIFFVNLYDRKRDKFLLGMTFLSILFTVNKSTYILIIVISLIFLVIEIKGGKINI